MEMKQVKSSNIEQIGYDPESEVLNIKFSKGSTYAYFGVSQQAFNEMEKAESVGKFFFAKIRGKFEFKKGKPQ